MDVEQQQQQDEIKELIRIENIEQRFRAPQN